MLHCKRKYYQDYFNYDPGLTLTYLTLRPNLVTEVFAGAKVKIMYYFETFEAIALKIALTIQINELLKLIEYQRSRSLFHLGHRYSDLNIQTCLSETVVEVIYNQIS